MYNASDAELIELRDYARRSARGVADLESAMMLRAFKCLKSFNGEGTFVGYAKSRMKYARRDAAKRYVESVADCAVLDPDVLAIYEEGRANSRPGTKRTHVFRSVTDRRYYGLPDSVAQAINLLPERQRKAVDAALTFGEMDLRTRDLRDAVAGLRALLGVTR